MGKTENILYDLFGDMPTFISNVNCYNRNEISIYSVNGKKVLFKKFNEKEFAEREKLFYEILKDSCKIPKVYDNGKNYLITEYVESSDPDLILAVSDWAKVHSRFIETKFLENSLFKEHKLRNLSDYVLNHRKIFGKNTEKLREILSSKDREKNYSTLIHGDLFGKNILTNNGNNYYIDFEFSGSGHPTKDLSLLLLNHPDMEKKIIETYRKNISFDYEGIEEDIKIELFNKGVQLIAGLSDLKMPLEEKNKIRKKFLSVLEKHL